jgi:hypothetical protein
MLSQRAMPKKAAGSQRRRWANDGRTGRQRAWWPKVRRMVIARNEAKALL